MYTDYPAWCVGNVEVWPLSDHEWRVRDRSMSTNDASSLLGFIEQTGATFEVTRLTSPPAREYFRTLADALAALSVRSYATA